jgi:hypothetical protein
MCKVKFVSVFVLLALLLSASVSMAQEPPLVSATSPGATPTRYRFEQVNEDMEYIAHGEFAGGLTHEVFEFSDGSAFETLLTPDAAYWRRPDWEAEAGWHKVELELVGPLNALLTPSYLLQIVTTAKAEVQYLGQEHLEHVEGVVSKYRYHVAASEIGRIVRQFGFSPESKPAGFPGCEIDQEYLVWIGQGDRVYQIETTLHLEMGAFTHSTTRYFDYGARDIQVSRPEEAMLPRPAKQPPSPLWYVHLHGKGWCEWIPWEFAAAIDMWGTPIEPGYDYGNDAFDCCYPDPVNEWDHVWGECSGYNYRLLVPKRVLTLGLCSGHNPWDAGHYYMVAWID